MYISAANRERIIAELHFIFPNDLGLGFNMKSVYKKIK